MWRGAAGFALALLTLAAAAAEVPRLALTIEGHAVQVEVAASEVQRQHGLMNRSTLGPDEGMLFVFDQPRPLVFWMKDTLVALSIAFVGADGTIVSIDDMEPQTRTFHRSGGPVMYALELPKGWFAQHGVAPGAKVLGLDHAPPAVD